jgi:hypothetical protein
VARASRQGENRNKPTEKEEENSHTHTHTHSQIPFYSLCPRAHTITVLSGRCWFLPASVVRRLLTHFACLLACVAKAFLCHWHSSNGKRIDANEHDDTGHEVRWRNTRLDRDLRGRMIRSERRSATRVGNRGFGEPQQRRREGEDYDDDRRLLLLAASSSPSSPAAEEEEEQAASKQVSACDAKKW